VSRSACPLDCPDRCSLEVSVEDGRVVAIEGSRLNPVTDGFICAKVRGYAQRVDGPDRLLHPLKRSGAKGEGRFTQISWDEALTAIALTFERVRREHGGEAILPFAYGGSNGLLSQGTSDEFLFRGLGASRLERTVCAAQTGAVAQAVYGKMPSVDFPDFAQARFIILWGANPKTTHIHLMPYLKAARDAGAKIALVDPRQTLPRGFVDVHLPVLPGSDAPVALAMIAHLERMGRVDQAFLEAQTDGWERLLSQAREWTLERAAARAGVLPQAIAGLAEAYASADPALIRCGWGVERNRNGEAAVAAILALPAVAGKFGKRGGGYALSSSEAYQVDSDRLAGAKEATTRGINMSQLGRVLLEEKSPPVKALFVYDANPAVTLPDQGRVVRGLLREDLFTVVFDQVMTDTALYADIVLPATTFLEQRDLSISYGTYVMLLSEPVVPRRGEARPNEEVFRALGERLGIPCPGEEQALREAVAAVGGALAGEPGSRLAHLRREGVVLFDFPGERPVQFVTVFPPTANRKICFFPPELGPDPYGVADDPGSASAPLALISPATDKSICSILAETVAERAALEMHPEDARSRGLTSGQRVRVYNPLGEVLVSLRFNPTLRPGVVYLPKGIWNRHTENGRVGTALVPDDVSAISGGALFNDARVEVSGLP
jgi:anaerobic selenocysteine-containing dehydrogenase